MQDHQMRARVRIGLPSLRLDSGDDYRQTFQRAARPNRVDRNFLYGRHAVQRRDHAERSPVASAVDS